MRLANARTGAQKRERNPVGGVGELVASSKNVKITMEEPSLTKIIKMRHKIWQTDAFFVGGNHRFSTFTLKFSVHRRNTIQLKLGKKSTPVMSFIAVMTTATIKKHHNR